jgi:hypothetical protein
VHLLGCPGSSLSLFGSARVIRALLPPMQRQRFSVQHVSIARGPFGESLAQISLRTSLSSTISTNIQADSR